MKELSITWHKTPECIMRAYWEPCAQAEGMTYEELIEGGILCGEDQDGNEYEIDQLAAIKDQGVWGFLDKSAGMIHAWSDDNADPALVIHMIAHEIGHATGEEHPDPIQEELRADQFGKIAGEAYRMMMEKGR